MWDVCVEMHVWGAYVWEWGAYVWEWGAYVWGWGAYVGRYVSGDACRCVELFGVYCILFICCQNVGTKLTSHPASHACQLAMPTN